jgi:hypothetical protein
MERLAASLTLLGGRLRCSNSQLFCLWFITLSFLLDPYGLDVDKLADAMSAEFASIAGTLYSTERQTRIRSDHAVDEDEALICANEQSLKGPDGKACTPKDLFNRQSALRHVRGVFEKGNVAGHKGGRSKSEDLPEWKVPGHDGENRPYRLVMNKTASRVISRARSGNGIRR